MAPPRLVASKTALGNLIGEERRHCALCNYLLVGEAIVAMNRLWHPDHFLCNGCKKPIRQNFQVADNHAYCVQCSLERFNPKCAGCNGILIDTCLLALGMHWHPRCFRFGILDILLSKAKNTVVAAYKYLRNEGTVPPKAMAITVGMASFVLGIKRYGIRKFIYAATCLATMAAFCFLHETWENFRQPPARKK